MIYPGDTQALSFTIPFNRSYIDRALISFRQQNITVLTVEADEINQLTDDTCTVNVELSQQESLQLANDSICEMQINVITTDGKRIPSEPFSDRVGEQFYKNIIQ